MTPEQKAANVALLARVVMHWRMYPDDWPARDWDPYTSETDALGMLGKFVGWTLFKVHREEVYACEVYTDLMDKHKGREHRLLDAICAACLEWARAQRGER